ncbi:arf-GAP with SH3 domain, ANK repeat and PH domain-containing protein 2 [Oryzias latipes]|uniref:Arf-GAP with SH3 domain, ANK repeat and PH domain-containing protein 3 n=1 Tax=Oryzias latipes TaxID=8090 RepID=A0A3B3I929_ORYLA|nr:arf-GAP with SH3 domain, ANK repeat and PH domain-containing protein 2 [Oryzias latipes]
MPDSISVSDFVAETNEDFKAPTTSSFTTRMPECRSTVIALEEGLDSDASLLHKIKKSLKAIHSSGMAHIESQEQYFQSLEKFGQRFLSKDDDCEIGSAFIKFNLLTKELTALFKNLVQNMNNIIFFPLESLLKGDLKGVKGDLRKSFDKAWKDYETKLAKIEKEKREHAKQHGLIRSEIIPGEIAEDMEKERQMFQLQMCEYFLKVNEIQVKKGVNFVQNLIKYFQIQGNFFQEGLKAVEDLKPSVEKLASNLVTIKQNQDGERKQLTQIRDMLKASMQAEQKEDLQLKQSAGYSLHQLQGDKVYGTERDGVLYKRSEGLRRVWQKRRCFVKNGFLNICHGTSNRDPAKLNLLTCQVKRNPDEKKSFDLFSHDRIYHFQAEDEIECQIWVSVLQNSKEEALNDAFKGGSNEGENNIVQELTKSIVEEVKKMNGNDRCCDCGAAGPTWLSTNLGVLICIECSGIHREIGVHYSRIQSLDLDVLGTSEMLLANNVGNASFNGIMEADLGPQGITKPDPSSDMQTRKEYITAKYTEKRFARRLYTNTESRQKALYEAVRNKDVLSLLQVYAEGVDLMEAVPQPSEHEHGETVLHLGVRMADRNSLHIVDFLAQNSPNLDKQTAKGNTALHYCCLLDNRECLKLLLRGRASVSITNEAGETPLDIAKRLQHSTCEELLTQVQTGKFNVHVHVEYQWRLQNEELDESEDEMEDKPIPSRRDERPISCFVPSAALQPSLAALARDAASMVRDKQRPPIPSSMISNETYGTAMDFSRPPPRPSPPPLPNRGLNKGGGASGGGIAKPEVGRQRSLSDPPNAPITEKNLSVFVLPVAPPLPDNWESKTVSAKNHPLPPVPSPPAGPPPVPPAPSLPPPSIHKPPPLPPHQPNYKMSGPSGPLGPKPPMPPPGLAKQPPQRPPVRTGSVEKSGLQSKSPHSPAPPLPKPRKNLSQQKPKRVKAIYNCSADQPDELTFKEGEVIVVEGEEDHDWWIGHVEGDPGRRGAFPVTFVHFISE